MNKSNSPTIREPLAWAQLATLVGGMAFVFIEFGRRDATLDAVGVKLNQVVVIVQDLTKIQSQIQEHSIGIDKSVEAINRRLDRIETKS